MSLYSDIILDDKPEAYWRLNGDGSDASGNNNTATPDTKGGLTWGAGLLDQDTDAAVVLDGVAGYLDIGTPLSSATVFTMEAWVKIAALPPQANPYGMILNPCGTATYLGVRSSGLFLCSVQLTNGQVAVNGVTVAQVGQTYHVAMTWDGTTLSLYLDGALEASVTPAGGQTPTSLHTAPGSIGRYYNSNYLFDGTIDEAALYLYALTADMVETHYQAGAQALFGSPILDLDGYPSVKVELALDSQPKDQYQRWTDVSARCRGFTVEHGRADELERAEASDIQAVLANLDRALDPDYAAGPYYGKIKNGKRIRVRACWNLSRSWLGQGFIDQMPPSWGSSGFDAVISVRASDWFKLFDRYQFGPGAQLAAKIDKNATTLTLIPKSDTNPAGGWPSTWPMVAFLVNMDAETLMVTGGFGTETLTVERAQNGTVSAEHDKDAAIEWMRPRETISARLHALCDAVGVPADERHIDEDSMTVEQTDGPTLLKTSALQHAQNLDASEGGIFFCGADGWPAYHNHKHRLNLPVSWVFGDATGEIGYTQLDPDFTEEWDFNDVQVTLSDGNTVMRAADTQSQDDHGVITEQISTLLVLETEGQAAADQFLDRHKNDQQRIRSMQFLPASDPANAWPAALGMEVSVRVQTKRRPPGGDGTPVVYDSVVERPSHTVAPDSWLTEVFLSPADTNVYWELGVAGRSEIGTTTVLSY